MTQVWCSDNRGSDNRGTDNRGCTVLQMTLSVIGMALTVN